MSIDRAALIEAAAKAQYEREVETHQIFDHGPWGQLRADYRDWFIPNAALAVDAVLPLIADAIEAEGRQVVQFFAPDAAGRPGSVEMGRLIGAEDAYKHTIRLVRSLLGTDSPATVSLPSSPPALPETGE